MKIIALVAPLVLLAAACSPPAEVERGVTIARMSEDARTTMERVNASRFTNPMSPTLQEDDPSAGVPDAPPAGPAGVTPTEATPAQTADYDAGLVRIQVLLDRAHFSPGVIDGYDGENVRKAVSAYQAANGQAVNGLADEALLTRLEQADSNPALVAYVITAEDVAGPFVDVPQDLLAMSELERVGYESAAEAIAEKFHMDEDLLRVLNPGVEFTTAGAEIVVANAGGDLSGEVASIEIDTREEAVRAFDSAGALLAYYPATVGTTEAPTPTGEHTVRGIAFDPTYRYDPARLPTFGNRGHGAVNIPGGPNNPVGAVWIALSADTYGIHGAPQPQLVSKTASHGCVRLTNWDAVELARASRQGVSVRFTSGTGLAQRSQRAG
jgi:lipoprotein-anchoring transpeptidase ErfK/SrfK